MPSDDVMSGPFFICDECGERYWNWHICPAQRARIAEWERQVPPMPKPTSRAVLSLSDTIDRIEADLDNLRDALDDLRRESIMPPRAERTVTLRVRNAGRAAPLVTDLDTGTQGSTLDWYTVLEWLLVDLRHINATLPPLQVDE